jgi:hypothetical protein
LSNETNARNRHGTLKVLPIGLHLEIMNLSGRPIGCHFTGIELEWRNNYPKP